MSSPRTKRMVYLKKKNQDLLAQLESNAAILEEHLKKLQGTARTSRQSRRYLPQSSPKRKSESWKARNNSGQVSAALHPEQSPSNNSSDSDHMLNTSLVTNAEVNNGAGLFNEPKMTSAAEQSRKYIAKPVTRKHTISSIKRQQAPSKPYSKTTFRQATSKSPVKVTSVCYCKTSNQNTNSKQKNKPGQICRKCSQKDCRDSVSVGLPPDKSLTVGLLYSENKVLEEARSVINYSPESVFLSRLKKRSQINLNAGELPKRSGRSKRTAATRKENRRSINSGSNSPQSLSVSPKPRRSTKLGNKNKTDVRTAKQQVKRENVNDQQLEFSKKESRKSKLKQAFSADIVAGLIDNEYDSKCPAGEKGEEWVDELSEFRRSHWFDCHAHPSNEKLTKDYKLENVYLPLPTKPENKSVLRYILNDRLFPVPLVSDHKNQNRNISSGVKSRTKSPPKYPLEITLDSMRAKPQVQVTLSQQAFTRPRDLTSASVGGFKITSSKANSTQGHSTRSGVLKQSSGSQPLNFKQPKPTNSLALRFQKGMI